MVIISDRCNWKRSLILQILIEIGELLCYTCVREFIEFPTIDCCQLFVSVNER